MDSDQGKLFVGGISWETTEDTLRDYFGQYGDVLLAVVVRDKTTGRPRGFGFVIFADPPVLDRVLQDSHTIDGRTVEAKKALSREDQQTNSRAGNMNPGRNTGSGGNIRTKKIFVGGLPPSLTDDEFRQYFETFGHVTDVVIMYDQNTQRPRGFGFISFDEEEAVDRVLHKSFHDLGGKQVEVKKALPKDANSSGGNRSMGGSSGGYQGYGNANSYDSSRMDSNRYMQSQNTGGGGFPSYGSSGYGYAPANNGAGYGGYGGYGAAYGNASVPNAGYTGGLPGAPRGSWSGQAPSGYGAMGYGNTATGQSPNGSAGYGNQGYGYGNYGGNDGSYGNSAGYGRSGGAPNNNAELQGYMGRGYGDANGNQGYGNAGWGSEQSQGSGNYGTQANGPQGAQLGYGQPGESQ